MKCLLLAIAALVVASTAQSPTAPMFKHPPPPSHKVGRLTITTNGPSPQCREWPLLRELRLRWCWGD